MIGLIMQAVGAAASMASQIVPDKNYVKKTSTYTPNSYSFQNAGLYNNAVGDIGEVDTYKNISEQSNLSKGLAGLGSALNVMGSFAPKGSKDKSVNATTSQTVDTIKPNNIGTDLISNASFNSMPNLFDNIWYPNELKYK